MTDDSRLMFESSATHHRVMTPLVTVSRRQDLPTLAERLAEVQAWLDSDLQVLDTALAEVEQCSGSPNLAERSARHLLRRKGKRLRPICTYLGARLAGLSQDDRVADLAVAAELVHAATLLHDDVIDEGTERRGEPAARIVYGNSASILGGDYLLIEALERVRRVDAGAPLSKILETITHMVSSEALQLEQRGRFVPDRDIYYRIIEGKTASLFRWALSAAPLMVGSDAAEPLARMGLELGLAFQLVDDALDLEGDPAEIGKDLFADLLQGKLTFPLIAACETEPTMATEIRDLARDATTGRVDGERAAKLVTRVRESGAIERTRDIAKDHKRQALAALSELPRTRSADALSLVVEAAVDRQR